MNCINKKNKEFVSLSKSASLHPLVLSAKVGAWQSKHNNYDRYPTLDELTQDSKSPVYYQNQSNSVDGIVATEKTIRDLSERMADRIGLNVRYESDRTLDYKGKLEGNTAVINLAHSTLDTPVHEILGHPIIRSIKGSQKVNEESFDILPSNEVVGYEGREGFIVVNYDNKISFDTFYPTKESAKNAYSEIKRKLEQPNSLYQNLLKELESGKGKEVLDRVKKDYDFYEVEAVYTLKNIGLPAPGIPMYYEEFSSKEEAMRYLAELPKEIIDNHIVEESLPEYKVNYTLEEQQEEAIVELLGLYTADRLDKVKDGKLISLLKRLLKEMKSFMRNLIGQKEVEIDKLPDNMTLGDIADLLAYSNSKLILPGNEVIYTTPSNKTFKTYQEASNHISELAKLNEVDLEGVKPNLKLYDTIKETDIIQVEAPQGKYRNHQVQYTNIRLPRDRNSSTDMLTQEQVAKAYKILDERGEDRNAVSGGAEFWILNDYNSGFDGESRYFVLTPEEALDMVQKHHSRRYSMDNYDMSIEAFISKNKEYEQSAEIIKEYKKVNNIQYDPEEVYSRGQGFYSVVGAYSDFDVELMFQNLLAHIEDNKKAGGEFTISAFTKPVGKTLGHLEGGGGKIKFKIFPKSDDIKWAANTDVYSGSVWDAGEKVSKDTKSELIGVSYTKAPSLRAINSVQPNLAAIIDNLAHHHNELAIELTANNFRLEYDNNVPYSTKKLINNINGILDEKFGKLVEPSIKSNAIPAGRHQDLINKSLYEELTSKEQTELDDLDKKRGWAKQPTQTKENLKESISSIKSRFEDNGPIFLGKPFISQGRYFRFQYNKENSNVSLYFIREKSNKDYYNVGAVHLVKAAYPDAGLTEELVLGEKAKFEESLKIKKEYNTQATINTKIAALKKGQQKFPRSLIRSEVVKSSAKPQAEKVFAPDELPFQKVQSNKKIVNELVSIASDTKAGATISGTTVKTNIDGDTVITYNPVKGAKKADLKATYDVRDRKVNELRKAAKELGLKPGEIVIATPRSLSPAIRTIIIKTPQDVKNNFYNYLIPPEEFYTKDPDAQTSPESYISDYATGDQYQLNTKDNPSIVNKKLNEKLLNILDKIGVKTESVGAITNSKGQFVNAVGAANIVEGTVQYVEGKLKEDTLAEETAHFMTEILKVNNRALYNSLVYNVKKQPEYAEVKQDYADTYDTEQQFIDEAIGKVVARVVISENKTKTTENIWSKVINFIKDLFAKFGVTSDIVHREMAPFVRAAELMMDETNVGEYSEILQGLKKSYDGIAYYQLSEATQKQYEYNFNNLNLFADKANSPIIVTDEGYVNRATGEVISKKVSDRVQTKRSSDEFEVKHDIKIRTYLDILGKNYSEGGGNMSYTQTKKDVYAKLKSHPEFVAHEESDPIWRLGSNADVSLSSFEELQDGIVKVIDDIKAHDEKLRHLTGSENNTEFFFELPVFDEMNDEAGTIDMVVLHPDGGIGVYNFKTIQFKSEGGAIIFPDIHIEKEFSYGTELSGYKDILRANLGKGTLFSETRVVPIQSSINYKNKASMNFVRMGAEKTNEEELVRAHLKHIPVADEITGHKTVDSALKGLYSMRDNLAARSKKKNTIESQLAIDSRLKKVRELIKSILIYPKLKVLTDEVHSLKNEFNTKLNANTSVDDMIILDDILEYEAYSELYIDLLTGLRDRAVKNSKDAETTESKEKYKDSANKINGLIWDLDSFVQEINDKREDIINQENPNVDLSVSYKKANGFNAQFKQLSQYDNPYFKIYSNEVYNIETRVQDSIDKETVIIQKVYDDILKFSKKSGMSVNDVYDKIINPNNGKLIWKYDREFYDKLKEAVEKKDSKWLLANADIEKNGKTFAYTGEALAKYNAARIKQEAILKSRHPYSDLEGSDAQNEINKSIRDHQMNIWDKRYNISSNPDAIYNTRNRFINLSDIESNYSNEWKFIIDNAEVKALYDMWVRLNTLAEEYSGKDISPNFLPDIQADMVESATNNGLPQTLNIMQHFRDALYVKENDTSKGMVDINTGEQHKGIPLLYFNSMVMNLDEKTEIPIIEKQLLAEDLIQGSEEYLEEFSRRIKIAERKKALAFKSRDLVRSAQMWAGSIYMHHYYKEREAFANSLLAHMKTADANPIVTNSQGNPILDNISAKAKTALGVANSEVENLQKFVNLYHYGQKVQGGDKLIEKQVKDSKGNIVDTKFVSATKGVKTSMSIMSAKALGLNIFSGIGNTIGVLSNMHFLKAENREITKEGFNAARKMYKDDRETYQALNEIIKPYSHNINFETANKVSASKLSRVLTLDHMYFMMKHPDELIDRTVTVTMAHTYGVNEQGNIVRIATNPEAKPVIDFLEKEADGGFKLNLSAEQRTQFKKKVQATGTKIKGSIPQSDRALWSTNVVMQVLMQFKSWMPGLISTRFKTLGYSNTMEELDVGRFRVVWGELFKDGFNFKNFGSIMNRMLPFYSRRAGEGPQISKKISQLYLEEFKTESPDAYDKLVEGVNERYPNLTVTETKAKILQEFMDMREAKMQAFVREVQGMILMYLLILGVGKIDPDDDDEVGKFATRNLQQALYRGYMELSFFYSPKTITDLMKTPAPVVTRTLKTIYQLSNNMIQETTDYITGEKNTNNKTPMGYFVLKNTVGVNQIHALFNENNYFSK